MLDPKTESEVREKAAKGICYKKGCNKPGKSRIQLTFATETVVDGVRKPVQALISAWACEDYDHRGGR